MVKLYKDLGKTAKKLLNDDYIYDKKVQLKTKTANGMTYTTTAVQSGKDDSLAGDLTLKVSPMAGVNVTTKLFTSGKMTEEIVMERLGVKGLKLTLLGGLGAKQSGVGTVEYVHPHVGATSSLDFLAGPIAHASITAGVDAFSVGAEAEYDSAAKDFKRYNFALNYADGKESEATFTVLNKGETAKLAYSHAARPDLSVAGEFLYDKSADAKLMTMGVKYDVDRETTLKAKFNSDGLLSSSYIQEIRPSTTLVLCHKIDVSSPEKPAHKLGLSLVVE